MNKDELAKLYKYCSPNSILIITYYGRIKQLKCPFRVTVNANVGNLKIRDKALVSKVLLSHSGKSVFVINGLSYYYYHFNILL